MKLFLKKIIFYMMVVYVYTVPIIPLYSMTTTALNNNTWKSWALTKAAVVEYYLEYYLGSSLVNYAIKAHSDDQLSRLIDSDILTTQELEKIFEYGLVNQRAFELSCKCLDRGLSLNTLTKNPLFQDFYPSLFIKYYSCNPKINNKRLHFYFQKNVSSLTQKKFLYNALCQKSFFEDRVKVVKLLLTSGDFFELTQPHDISLKVLSLNAVMQNEHSTINPKAKNLVIQLASDEIDNKISQWNQKYPWLALDQHDKNLIKYNFAQKWKKPKRFKKFFTEE